MYRIDLVCMCGATYTKGFVNAIDAFGAKEEAARLWPYLRYEEIMPRLVAEKRESPVLSELFTGNTLSSDCIG